MPLGDSVPAGEEYVPRRFEEIETRIRELAASVPESFAPVVARLRQTIIDTIAETYSTTDEMEAAIANPPNGVAAAGPVSGTALSTPGAVTAGAAVSAGGNVTAGGSVAANGGDVRSSASLRGVDLYATAAPGVNITGTRVAAWLETATGRLGTASSSERFKENIRPTDIDPEAVLAMEPVFFHYVAELAERERRAALPSPYAEWTPDYKIHTEVGMIAERLHEAGLWPFVIYERDPYGNAIHDEDGHPIPFGIHYQMWSVAQQVALRHLHTKQQDLEQRIAALEARTD